MTVSTHVLDTARGIPAAGVAVTLYVLDGADRKTIGEAVTNDDGRTDAPLGLALHAGTYELVFSVGAYFKRDGTVAFYDEIPIRFILGGKPGRYHVPLLISPWGYSTYRGS
jgi:5-hydroxyisourate hydrolase